MSHQPKMNLRAVRVIACAALLAAAAGGGDPAAGGDDAQRLSQSTPSAPGVPAFTAPSRKAQLAVAQTVRIKEYCVCEGDIVRAGSAIAVFDDEVQRARAEISRIRAESGLEVELAAVKVQFAEAEHERVTALGVGRVSAIELLTARTALDTARLEHRLAERNLEERRRDNALQIATLDTLRLAAPFDGVIAERRKEVGETAEAHDAIVTLLQLNPLLVAVDCPIEQAHAVRSGAQFRVRPVDSRFGERFGEVYFVSPIADAASQTVKIKLSVGNVDAAWIAGMKVVVDFGTQVAPDAAARQ